MYKTRVVVVTESGIGVMQDFFTPSHALALVQFGEENAETLRDDPAASAVCIEVNREDWTAEEEEALALSYCEEMMKEVQAAKVAA